MFKSEADDENDDDDDPDPTGPVAFLTCLFMSSLEMFVPSLSNCLMGITGEFEIVVAAIEGDELSS